MKYETIRSIKNNTFLPNYCSIYDYFEENNLVYTGECKIDGGFTLNYNCTDTRELFEQNLKIQPQDWYYRTHPVKYTLNSLGYRTKEFDDIDWKESIVIFGCSYIFGTGVTDEHTIPYFLEQLSGRPVINMGIPSSSIQTSLHNAIILNDSEYPTPKVVVNFFTDLHRFQIYEKNNVEHCGLWDVKTGNPEILDKKNIQKFSNAENVIPFNLMNIKMMRNLWKNKTIYREFGGFATSGSRSGEDLIIKIDSKFNSEYPQVSISEVEIFGYETPSRGRDVMPFGRGHFGIEHNKNIAEILYKNIKLQLDT
jgi:hypothetical protein